MADIIARGMAARLAGKIKDLIEKVESIGSGINWLGAVDYIDNLPTNSKIGDAYTVKYMGSSGNIPNGTEYVYYINSENEGEWIPFGPDMNYIQSELESLKNDMPYILDLT